MKTTISLETSTFLSTALRLSHLANRQTKSIYFLHIPTHGSICLSIRLCNVPAASSASSDSPAKLANLATTVAVPVMTPNWMSMGTTKMNGNISNTGGGDSAFVTYDNTMEYPKWNDSR